MCDGFGQRNWWLVAMPLVAMVLLLTERISDAGQSLFIARQIF